MEPALFILSTTTPRNPSVNWPGPATLSSKVNNTNFLVESVILLNVLGLCFEGSFFVQMCFLRTLWGRKRWFWRGLRCIWSGVLLRRLWDRVARGRVPSCSYLLAFTRSLSAYTTSIHYLYKCALTHLQFFMVFTIVYFLHLHFDANMVHGCAMQPTDGRVTLAGIDVRKFDKSEWARAISIVNQVLYTPPYYHSFIIFSCIWHLHTITHV